MLTIFSRIPYINGKMSIFSLRLVLEKMDIFHPKGKLPLKLDGWFSSQPFI
jgi:hypothetical protein